MNTPFEQRKEELVEEFDKKFAHQDHVQNEIPLADMHDWLRTALSRHADAVMETEREKFAIEVLDAFGEMAALSGKDLADPKMDGTAYNMGWYDCQKAIVAALTIQRSEKHCHNCFFPPNRGECSCSCHQRSEQLEANE